ncbi:MAG: sigma-54-dependent transcriptional regulator [Desulfomonilaceae bacterium]
MDDFNFQSDRLLAGIREVLSMWLETEGHHVVTAGSYEEALRESHLYSFDIAFVDMKLRTKDGLDLIPALLASLPWLKIVVITAYASIENAVEAIRRGAADYIAKPFTLAQVNLAVLKQAELRSLELKVAALQEELSRFDHDADFSSTSPIMQRAVDMVREVAPTDATVLLRGESGTGKTVLARAAHHWSKRANRPFGVISCPSLNSELLESQLFGHVKGAFTGAVSDRIGRIAACEGGTLFLDEMGALPVSVQPKLLRFLQDKEYERVGSYSTRKANVRIIASTNVDLERAVKENLFREDLLFRLNVIQITIPPLRDRPDDIIILAERLLAFFGRNYHKLFSGFTQEAADMLTQYSWPGNARELRNVVERAAILCHSDRIRIEHLPDGMSCDAPIFPVGHRMSLKEVEKEHVRRVLRSTKTLGEAAKILGIDKATLWRRRKQYCIQ